MPGGKGLGVILNKSLHRRCQAMHDSMYSNQVGKQNKQGNSH